MTFSKEQLIEIFVEMHNLKRKEASQIVNVFFETLITNLALGKNIKFPGFGNFVILKKKPRIGRNPKTGEEYPIMERFVVRFRPAKKLKEKLTEKDSL